MKLNIHFKKKTNLTLNAIKIALTDMETPNIVKIDLRPTRIVIYASSKDAGFVFLTGIVIGRFIDEHEVITVHTQEWEKGDGYEKTG